MKREASIKDMEGSYVKIIAQSLRTNAMSIFFLVKELWQELSFLARDYWCQNKRHKYAGPVGIHSAKKR